MEVNILIFDQKSNKDTPKYQSKNAAGIDLLAETYGKPITISSKNTSVISTGIALEIPTGYEGQIRSRSGLAVNHQIFVLNSPGTIDADYRGEIKVILYNLSEKDFVVNNGDRIAQLVFNQIIRVDLNTVTELPNTDRGTNGFGSTGT